MVHRGGAPSPASGRKLIPWEFRPIDRTTEIRTAPDSAPQFCRPEYFHRLYTQTDSAHARNSLHCHEYVRTERGKRDDDAVSPGARAESGCHYAEERPTGERPSGCAPGVLRRDGGSI